MKQTALFLLLAGVLLAACSGPKGTSPSATRTIALLPTVEATLAPSPVSVTEATPGVTPTAAPQAVSGVATDTLNVRAGPGLTFAVKSQLKEGDKITITGKSADGLWWQFSGGWVSGTYIRVTGDAAGLPVATPGPMSSN